MKLIALDIPDDPAALPGWLDRHLVGLDLAALVAELEAVHGPPSAPLDSLDQVLGDRRDEVLERGLAALSADRLRTLLRRPALLLDLQELILVEGGAYWHRLGPPVAEQEDLAARGRQGLAAILPTEMGTAPERSDVLPIGRSVAWYRRPWVVNLATAASVLAMVVAYERSARRVPPATTAAGWGWNRPDALPRDVPPSDYLNRLADTAGEWFNKRPDDPVALARRIAEFRQGCSILILADHKVLSAEDRTWLVEKCRGWAAKLDAHLAAVEAGRDPSQVRIEADETVNTLIRALRDRARAVA